jgi:hypothetical protein
MKRLHVHVSVDSINNAIAFYSALFAAKPSVIKDDYAKWMLDDPHVNFAISSRGHNPGLDHLGIQVESESELQDVYARLREAGQNAIEQGKTTCCCYARQTLQRPVSLHRKLGTLDPGRGYSEQDRATKILRIQRGKPAQGASQREHSSTVEKFEL